jgi:hypothetical protein
MTSIAFLGPSLAGDYVLSLRVADAFFYSSPDYVIVHVRDNLLELTRFRGHLTIGVGGFHDAKEVHTTTAVPA